MEIKQHQEPPGVRHLIALLLSFLMPRYFLLRWGGDVSGLASGASIVLQNNGADDQTLSVDGSFTFTQQSDGSSYDVTVATQPDGQTCAVTSGTGTLAGADVSGVSVSCADNSYTIGGQITGLISGDPVVLQNNGGDNLTLTSDGAFTFSAPIPYTTAYSVTVLTQPSAPSETCTVTNGAGKVPNSNVNNVAVVCALNSFTVGGSVSGLTPGGSVELQNNGADSQTLMSDGAFTFTAQADGTAYIVSVATQPDGQTCAVTSGTGTLAGADVSGVSVSCADNSYTIGGQITGLISGDPVVLQNNGGDNLTLTSDGAFTFSAPIPYTTAYSVTVLTQPSAPSETCTVTNGAGKVPNSNVNNVAVVCALNSFTVGGSVSGLTPGGSIELQNNGADSQTLMSDGAFTFTAQADGTAYIVSVATQPDGQTCAVTSGTGTLAGADVSGVSVSCADNSYTIGGQITGLISGDPVVLQNNGGDNLTLTSDGAFTFSAPIPYTTAYSVTVLTQPSAPSETCTVTNGAGKVPNSNVNNVAVVCALNSFTVGGSVSGLTPGGSIELQNNGADSQTLMSDGAFTFTAQADGTAYIVSVATQPDGQTCAVTSGTGTLAGADVSGVSVSCADNSYTIGGQITGLISGDPVVLQNNGGDNLTLTSDGAFTFSAPIPYTTAYSVTVLTQPSAPSETCTVTNGAGKVPNSNVNNVAVVCALNSFTVGGSVSGLTPGGSIELQNNGADSQTLMSDGAFTFTAQADGSTYSVTVSSQPEGQMCSVTSGGGTLAGLPVTNVAVSCVNNQYTVGGLLSGLVAGDTVVLQNNNGDDLRLTADGAFTFATKLGFQDAYAVTILSQSGGLSETCTLSNGSGTMGASSVDNVSIICALDSFTVGGSVSGLVTGESVVLQNNGVDSQTQSTDGNFVFSKQADGSNYAVTIATQPVSQICSVADGSGSLAGADVSRVLVSCVNVLPPKIITPVPTNPLWLLGIMAGLLSLVGMSKLRKR